MKWNLLTLIRLEFRKLMPVLSRTLVVVGFGPGVFSFWVLAVICLCGAVCFWFTHVQQYLLEEMMSLSGWRTLGSCTALFLGLLGWLGFEHTKKGHQYFFIFGLILIQLPLLITSLVFEGAYPFLHPINDGVPLYSLVYHAAKVVMILSVLTLTRYGLSQPRTWLGWILAFIVMVQLLFVAANWAGVLAVSLSPLYLGVLLGFNLWIGRVGLVRYCRHIPSYFAFSLVLAIIPDMLALVYVYLGCVLESDSLMFVAALLGLIAHLIVVLGLSIDLRTSSVGHHIAVARLQVIEMSLQAQLELVEQNLSLFTHQYRQLEQIISAMGEAVITTNREGQICYMNPAAERLTGRRYKETDTLFLDQVLLAQGGVVSPRLEPSDNLERWASMTSGQAWLQAKDMRLVPIEYTAAPLLGKNQNDTGMVIAFHDNTEQRRSARESLQARDVAIAASNSKTEFLACMSHEIRTPMNAIIGMVDLLLDTDLTPEQLKFIQASKAASKNLLSLINGILDVSMMESGYLQLEPQLFCIRDIVKSQIHFFRTEALRKGINIECTIADDLPDEILGDHGRLAQILFNLMGNAIKFTHCGQVMLNVRRENDHALFSVADTGIGVPVEDQSRIFDLFTQVDSSTTREYKGTGLGLAICRSLVQKMGGSIWVHSTEGVGSTFYFTIALKMPHGAEPPAPAAANEEDGGLTLVDYRPLEILLVEDSVDNRMLLEFYFAATPYKVQVATNGQDAVDLYAQAYGHFDMILMDIQMPVMDGYTATTMIRKMEKELDWRHCPILALTASVLDESIFKSFAAGCDDHLKKPIDRKLLIQTIGRHAAHSRKYTIAQVSAVNFRQAIQGEMCELVPIYLQNRNKDLVSLDFLHRLPDFEQIRTIAHRMKGSGASYGFDWITELGAELEHFSNVTDIEQVRRCILDLGRYLAAIEGFMRAKT